MKAGDTAQGQKQGQNQGHTMEDRLQALADKVMVCFRLYPQPSAWHTAGAERKLHGSAEHLGTVRENREPRPPHTSLLCTTMLDERGSRG